MVNPAFFKQKDTKACTFYPLLSKGFISETKLRRSCKLTEFKLLRAISLSVIIWFRYTVSLFCAIRIISTIDRALYRPLQTTLCTADLSFAFCLRQPFLRIGLNKTFF